MKNKTEGVGDALRRFIKSGQTIMVGGFGRGGTPFTILDALAEKSGNIKDLTLVKNDGNEPNLGIGKLFPAGMVSHLISTHVGLNPDLIARMHTGEIPCELIPQGTFAEKIRAGGAGIPAFLTDVGIDTPYGEGKEILTIDGQRYILEKALTGDTALLCADIADTKGNAFFKGTNRNMNVVMGMACSATIVEAKNIVSPGEITPEHVHLPGVLVDAVVKAEPRKHMVAENEK